MRITFILFTLSIFVNANAQKDSIQSIKSDLIYGFGATYSYQAKFLDFKDKYTSNSNIGLTGYIKLPSNLTFGIEGNFIFGGTSKDLMSLGNVVTNTGFVIGTEGSLQQGSLDARGAELSAYVGKIFPVMKKNRNTGFLLRAGIGYIFHHTFFNVDDNLVPQFANDYDKGYNDLVSGISFSQFAGYQIFSKDKYINAIIGLQNNICFTNYVYNYDFGSNESLVNKSETFILFGPKVGINIAIYKSLKPEESFYFN